MVKPMLMPRYEGAETAGDVAEKQGEIATDTYNRLIRLQGWVRTIYASSGK